MSMFDDPLDLLCGDSMFDSQFDSESRLDYLDSCKRNKDAAQNKTDTYEELKVCISELDDLFDLYNLSFYDDVDIVPKVKGIVDKMRVLIDSGCDDLYAERDHWVVEQLND